jgi:branched-chain amino acid transport system permease protein
MGKFRTAITIGAIGAAITLLFGGWSMILVGTVVGAMTGLSYGQRSSKRGALDKARDVLLPALISTVIMALGGVLYTFVITPLTGKPLNYNQPLKFGTDRVPLDSITVFIIGLVAGIVIGVVIAALIAYLQGLPEKVRRVAFIASLIVFLFGLPFFDQVTGLDWIAAIITIQIFILLALGLNIVVGYAGLLDLGYAAFFAIGAYTTGLLSSPQINIYWNFWLVIWVAAAMAAFAGLVLGAPTLPLRGDYLAIVTLGFGEIIPVVFRNLITVTLREPFTRICFVGCDPKVDIVRWCFYACEKALDLTAGEKGINPIGRPIIPFTDESLFSSRSYMPWYFLVFVLIILSIFFIRRLRNSRIGRAWMAIREDELAASQMGIDPVKTKLLAFSMGATFSGFAGAFYGAYISAIFPSVFDFSVSVIILCMVILGGLGNMVGVIIGGILIMGTDRLFLPQIATLLKDFMRYSVLGNISNPVLKDFLEISVDPNQMRLAIFGLVLVIMMIVRPEGLVPSEERRAELHEGEEEHGDAATEAAA